MNAPLISIILSVYNGQKYIEDALESVLVQRYDNIEVIIVDDGSTDDTAEIANKYLDKPNISYVFQENSGPAAAQNRGISTAKGEFFSFIDHDDIWAPEKLEVQLNTFLENPELEVVFSHMKSFADNDEADRLSFQRDSIPGYCPGTMLARKEVFLKVGYFDTSITKGYFFPWIDSLKQKKLNILLLDNMLYHRRVHGENISISNNNGYGDYFAAIRSTRKQRENEN